MEPYITGDVFSPATAGIGTKTVTLAVTDSGCTVTDTALYTVVPAFGAQALPLNSQICFGTSVTLTASVNPRTAGAVYTYQWKDSLGKAIDGATDSVYTTTVHGNYTCVITLSECQAQSAPASIEYLPFAAVIQTFSLIPVGNMMILKGFSQHVSILEIRNTIGNHRGFE